MRSSYNPNQRQGHPNTYKPEHTNSGFVYEVPHVYSWGRLLVASYSNTSTLSVSGMRKRPYHCVMLVYVYKSDLTGSGRQTWPWSVTTRSWEWRGTPLIVIWRRHTDSWPWSTTQVDIYGRSVSSTMYTGSGSGMRTVPEVPSNLIPCSSLPTS